jgi:lipopolysaccharide exporter
VRLRSRAGETRPAILVALPAPGSDRQDRGEAPLSSLRKPVPAMRPADPAATNSGVGDRQRAPVNPPTTVPTTGTPNAEVDSGGEPTDETVSPDGPRSAMINGLRWTMIGRPVVELANLFGAAVLARFVSPAEFGRYAIALIVLFLASVPTQAVQYAIVQRKHIDRDHLRTGVTLTILLGLAVCAFCLAASCTVVPLLFGERTAVLVRLMIPACFINSVNTVQIASITRRLEFRRLSILDMTITLVGLVAMISLAAIGLNGEAMVLGMLAGGSAGFILVSYWMLPPIPNFRRRAARDLLRSGIPAASGAASIAGLQSCDYLIVGARLGALQAGYYFRAYTLSVMYQQKVTQVMTSVGFPVLSRAASEDEVDHLRQRMVHTITLILFPLLTALVIVAPKFVTWFYGPAWGPTVLPVQILALGGGAMLLADAVAVAMLATGQARAVARWGWGHFLAYGAAVFATAPFGLPAVALAAAAVHTVFLVIAYIQLQQGCVRRALATLANDILPAAACSVGFAVVAVPISVFVASLGIPTFPYLIIVAVAGGAGYFATLRLWFPSELRHLGLLAQRLLPSRTHRVFSRFVVRAGQSPA